MRMMHTGKRYRSLMLPAIAFIVAFRQLNTEPGKTDFSDQGFNLCREEPDLFFTLPEMEVFIPFQANGAGGLGNV